MNSSNSSSSSSSGGGNSNGSNNQQYIANFNNGIYTVYFYASCFLLPIGLILNSISFYVFTRPKLFKTNFGYLSALLALQDTFSLYWNLLAYKLLPLVGWNMATASHVGCVLLQFLSRLIQQLPLFLQILIAFDNFVKIKYPFKFKFLNKKSNLLISIFIIDCTLAMINIPNALRYLVITETYTYAEVESFNAMSNSTNESLVVVKVTQSRTCASTSLAFIVSYLITSAMRTIVCTTILATLNMLTFKALLDNKKKLNKGKKLGKENAKNVQFGIICIVLDTFFFLFNFPLSTTEIMIVVYQYVYMYPSSSYQLSLINYLHSYTNTISFMYYIVSFFIHLKFNTIYRAIIFSIIGKTYNENTGEKSIIRSSAKPTGTAQSHN